MSSYQPYIYLIGWSKIDRWYIGARYRNGCHPDDLWSTYFTSSKLIPAIRYLYGEPDVVRAFPVKDKTEALLQECVVIFYLGAVEGNRYLNQSNFGCDFRTGKRIPFRLSKSVYKKQSASRKGRKLSPEHISKSAAARRGLKRTPETRKRISESMKGKTLGVPRPAVAAALRGRKQSTECQTKKRQKLIESGHVPPIEWYLEIQARIARGDRNCDIMSETGIREGTLLKIKRGVHWSCHSSDKA